MVMCYLPNTWVLIRARSPPAACPEGHCTAWAWRWSGRTAGDEVTSSVVKEILLLQPSPSFKCLHELHRHYPWKGFFSRLRCSLIMMIKLWLNVVCLLRHDWLIVISEPQEMAEQG